MILCICRQFPFAADKVRVVLFRECDIRGRKLLFDSSAVEKIPDGPASTTATASCGTTNYKTLPQTQKCDHCKIMYQVCLPQRFKVVMIVIDFVFI